MKLVASAPPIDVPIDVMGMMIAIVNDPLRGTGLIWSLWKML